MSPHGETGHCSSRFIRSMAVTLSYLADRMKKLIKGAGMALDIKTNDEALILMHSIGLLETKLGVKEEGPDSP